MSDENIAEKQAEPVWCLVANVVEERSYGPGGAEKRRGTKHFALGAKVHCLPVSWGDGYEKIKVIGRHRGSHRYVTMIVNAQWLTNWRAQLIYSPFLIEEIGAAWGETPTWWQVFAKSPKLRVEEYIAMMKERESSRTPPQE